MPIPENTEFKKIRESSIRRYTSKNAPSPPSNGKVKSKQELFHGNELISFQKEIPSEGKVTYPLYIPMEFPYGKLSKYININIALTVTVIVLVIF